MDLYATLLSLAGIERPSDLDSRSVLPLIEGDEGERPETAMSEFNGHHYHYQSRMVTDGLYKYVFNAPEIDELYDLQGDPWETRNLISDDGYAGIADSMRDQLILHCEGSEDPLLGWIHNLYSPREKEYAPYGGNYGAGKS